MNFLNNSHQTQNVWKIALLLSFLHSITCLIKHSSLNGLIIKTAEPTASIIINELSGFHKNKAEQLQYFPSSLQFIYRSAKCEDYFSIDHLICSFAVCNTWKKRQILLYANIQCTCIYMTISMWIFLNILIQGTHYFPKFCRFLFKKCYQITHDAMKVMDNDVQSRW